MLRDSAAPILNQNLLPPSWLGNGKFIWAFDGADAAQMSIAVSFRSGNGANCYNLGQDNDPVMSRQVLAVQRHKPNGLLEQTVNGVHMVELCLTVSKPTRTETSQIGGV